MFTFDNLKSYGAWQVTATERVSSAQLSRVKVAEVVISTFDDDSKIDIKITMNDGTVKYLGLSKSSSLKVGDTVDLSKGSINTLSKDGKNIYRFIED